MRDKYILNLICNLLTRLRVTSVKSNRNRSRDREKFCTGGERGGEFTLSKYVYRAARDFTAVHKLNNSRARLSGHPERRGSPLEKLKEPTGSRDSRDRPVIGRWILNRFNAI